MSAQLSYSYYTPKGVPGGLMDLSPYSVNSRINGETDDGKLLFGMGAVQGANPGSDVLIPTTASTVSQFEGLVLADHITQMDMAGNVKIAPLQTVGMLRWGKAWARIEDGITPAYGEALYLINTGDNAGLFTNDDGGGTNLVINGKFIGSIGTGNVAPVEIYNQNS